MKKGLDERIDEGGLRWIGYVERMENDRITRPRKRWINTVKDRLKKGGLDVRQAMVHDKSVGWEFVRGNAWDVSRRMNP